MTLKAASPKAPAADVTPQKRKSVFVVSPIGAPGTEVYRKASYALKYIFRVALPADEWHVHRADEGESPDSISQHVIRKLWEADLVIADLTGHNPNVFYELAIAHGWRKPVVHLIAKGETIPFDIVDQRTIFYDITDLASVEETVEMLRKYSTYAMSRTEELITPLTSFEKFSHIREDSTDGGAAVAEVLEEVVTRLSRLEHRIMRRESAKSDGERVTSVAQGNDAIIEEVSAYMSIINRLESADSSAEPDASLINEIKGRVSDKVSNFSPHVAAEIIQRAKGLQSALHGQLP
ncbi:hypothetical protein [[Micrococcus luteus] ATCC 49442]|uniref:hypothetical protein n=1 Tax=[Micrococcus luteus] ATCC 49442 TaxID=2698727 RepID=UPI0013DB1D75|nr:hypothetical protein [[Micrococcus luteus] ATCC 49442]